MATRREAMQAGVGGAILGLAGGGRALVDAALKQRATPVLGTGVSGLAHQCNDPVAVVAPHMDHKSALAKVFGDVFLRAKMRAQLYEQYRFCVDIDPDIAVLKSLSPMAKITITRQRRVERELQDVFTIPDCPRPYSFAHDMVNKYVQKLMWGNP